MDGGIPQILKTSALFDHLAHRRAVAAAWSHVKFFRSWARNVTELGLAVLDGERNLLNMSSLVPTEGTRRLVVMGGGPIGIEMCLQALREKESAAHCNFNFHVTLLERCGARAQLPQVVARRVLQQLGAERDGARPRGAGRGRGATAASEGPDGRGVR